MDKIRWGILGCGGIARTFARELAAAPHAVLAAAASRTAAGAEKFKADTGVPVCFDSYEELAVSDLVDAIYIATPHGRHLQDTLLCLENGKPVLCEKAFALSAKEGELMVSLAREKKLYLVEAMWTRWFPASKAAKRWMQSGLLGEVRHVTAEYGFAMDMEKAAPRLYLPECGGGSLLDVGIYTLSFASFAFGGDAPEAVTCLGRPLPNGMDAATDMLLRYGGGTAALCGSFETTFTSRGAIYGERGHIEFENGFVYPHGAVLTVDGKVQDEIHYTPAFGGHEYMIEDVSLDLLAGKTESEILPLDETLTILRTADEIRRQIGLRYPQETAL